MKMTNNVHVGEIVFIVTAEHEESELAAYLNGEKQNIRSCLQKSVISQKREISL